MSKPNKRDSIILASISGQVEVNSKPYQTALAAVNGLMADCSRPKQETLFYLDMLREEIDVMVDAIRADIARDARKGEG